MSTPPLTAEQERLVLDNQRLIPFAIAQLAPRGHHPGEDDEDDISAGQLGLIHAARIFDPAKGAFTTIAVAAIRNAVRQDRGNRRGSSYRRAISRREFWQGPLSLDAPVRRGVDESGPVTLGDRLADSEVRPDDGSRATDLLTDLLGELPQRDRIALTEDREHAAEILGISPAGVHRRFYRARARLRAAHPELVTTETADHHPELAA